MQANQTLGVGAVLGPRRIRDDLAMSNTDTSELLRLCDAILHSRDLYQTNPEAWGQSETIARALRSRLQAESPEDAEVAEIEKRHADCEAFYSSHGPFRPTWQFDRATLLAKLRARTQAEAQAPTTVAQAVYAWVRDDLSTGAHVQKLIDRLTVGAPAPAPTIDPASSPGVQPISGVPHNSGSSPGVLHNNPDTTAPATTMPTREQIARALCQGMEQNGGQCWDGLDKFNRGLYYDQADAILALFAKGDTPAPKHALRCGYWLDLNCSCGLEDDTP